MLYTKNAVCQLCMSFSSG